MSERLSDWFNKKIKPIIYYPKIKPTQSAKAVDSTNSISAEGLISTSTEYPSHDNQSSDSDSLVLEHWGIWSTPSLLLLPGCLWPKVVAPDMFISMGQIELFDI